MGTEVQSKMYLPGYYSMKDISNSSSYGGWSLTHENSPLKNGQHYGMYVSTPITDGVDYDAYEKEKLRQTIMNHESIFRHQVHELHRLYRIQRDLMNEARNKGQVNRLMPVGGSQRGLFSSSFPFEDEKRSWHASGFPFVGSNHGRPSSSSAGVIQSPQSSVKLAPVGGARLDGYDEALDVKCKKPQRRLFDLEVPADEYIDDETEVDGDCVASRTVNPRHNQSNEVTQARDKNLSGHVSDDGNALRSNSHSRRTHNLADLNEPVKVEEVSASASDNNLGSEIYSQEQIQSRAGSTHVYSNMWFAAKQLSENPIFGKNRETSNAHLETETRENERSSYSFQAGKVGGKSYFSTGLRAEDFRKPSDSSRVEAGKANGFVTSLPSDPNTSGKQIKRKIFGVEVAEGNNDASSLASKPINMFNSESSSISSWTKPQTSLNSSVIQCGPQGSLWTHASANSAMAVSDVATPSKYPYSGVPFAEPRKAETPQAVLPWLRTFPLENGTSLKEEAEVSHGLRIDSTRSGLYQFWNQSETRKGPTQSPIQDSSSTTRGREAENRRVDISECSSVRTIHSFPIVDLSSKPDPLVSVRAAYDIAIEKLKVEDLKKDRSYVKHQIDLNECVVEEEAQLTPSSPPAKRTTGIDLEAPVVVEPDSDEESILNRLESPLESLDKLAAEALVSIASHRGRLQEDETQTPPLDALHLLADIVSSYNDEDESIRDEIDDFEQIILALPEVKPEEQCYVAPIGDLRREEEEESAAPRRQRRGQARRGRQRVKDFQRDVLPGMVSLSRNEVTEDLQTIEGLVRGSGGSWQPSLALRSGGGRGRRRSAPPAEAAAACEAPPGNDPKEPGLEETNLAGWGKRTRRPPRQRCPISNSLLPLK